MTSKHIALSSLVSVHARPDAVVDHDYIGSTRSRFFLSSGISFELTRIGGGC
jgi:hypothetical protein